MGEDDIPPPMATSAAKRPQPAVPDPTPMFKPTIEEPAPPASVPRKTEPAPAPAPAPRKVAPTPPTEPSSSGPSQSAQSTELQTLTERRDQYKKAALTAKHSGDMATARNYVKISKVRKQSISYNFM